MRYHRGPDRSQTQLLPPSVEDYVAEDSLVRVIDAFVEGLDLVELGFLRAAPKALGRPGYYPGDLLRLYIYGYVNRIRSSRRLEAEATRNLEVLWLLRSLKPDFKTIADFRRVNIACFKGVLREFNLLCRKLNLFAAELVAIDGSKFKASNNFRKSYTAEQLRELLARIDDGISRYMESLDQADAQAEGSGRSGEDGNGNGSKGGGTGKREEQVREFKRKLAQLDQEKAECQSLLNELDQLNKGDESTQDEPLDKRGDARRGDARQGDAKSKAISRKDISRTDRDSRRMKRGNGAGTLVGYNVQVAVDGKHGLIVAEDVVTAANDINQLSAMAGAALQTLEGIQAGAATGMEVEPPTLRLVADSGYCEADELLACEEMSSDALKVEAYVPRRSTTQGQGAKDSEGKAIPIYAKDEFVYDAGRDSYRCPAGQELTRKSERLQGGKLNYQYESKACTRCELKTACTTSRYRSLTRRSNEGAVERARERVKSNPAMMLLRQSLVERVFGTLRLTGHDQFLMRGLNQVRGEFSLSSLSYNLRRCVNLIGVKATLQAIG